jgi:putative acetyltransferase
MNPKIVIRSETDADVSAITEVTVAAFKTLEISNHTEQFIIEALRAAKALTVSLVAEADGRVIGHIETFTREAPTTYPQVAHRPTTRLGAP